MALTLARKWILGLALAAMLPACGGSGGGGGLFSLSGLPDPMFRPGGSSPIADLHGGTVAAVVIQPDGKILAAGTGTVAGEDVVGVVRLLPDGSLDPSFGDNGIAARTFPGTWNTPTCMVLQTDGKIVLGGDSSSGAAVFRLNANGSADTTFDSDGMAVVSFPSGSQIFAVALQADGKIVIGGQGSNELGLARFNTNGSIDTTFDTDGMTTTTFNGLGGEEVHAVLIQPDGKIVAVGQSMNMGAIVVAVLRYNANGSLDASFDTDGKLTASFGSGSCSANAAVLLPDGKILVAGYAEPTGSDQQFLLARFTSSGVLDAGYGSGGAVLTPMGPDEDEVLAMLRYPDGRILVGGLSYDTADPNLALARFTADGALDPAFGTGGKIVRTIAAEEDYATALALQADGRIVLGLRIYTYSDEFTVMRLLGDGSPDDTFHPGGSVVRSFSDYATTGGAVAVRADGKILVAGTRQFSGAPSDFFLARFNGDGMLDPTFGNSGVDPESIQAGDDAAGSIAVQTDGKILVGGRSNSGAVGAPDLATLARFLPNGNLDGTFGSGGKVFTAGTGTDIVDLAIQADGKILAAVADTTLAVYRYNANGTLDAGFGSGGKAALIALGVGFTQALALQPDGKVVVVGYRRNSSNDFLITYRLDSSGALDPSFGTGGFVEEGGGSLVYRGRDLALQPDGKIVVALQSIEIGGFSQMVVLRYNSNGTPDTAFDGDGRADLTPLTENHVIARITVQADGRIVATGQSNPYDDGIQVLRLNPNGSLDGSFGTGGITLLHQQTDFEFVNGLALQADGAILLVGTASNINVTFMTLDRILP